MQNISLPDGRTLTLTGEETPQQIAAIKDKIRFELSQSPTGAAVDTSDMPQSKGFTGRMGDALSNRITKSVESIARTEQLMPFVGGNAQSVPETMAQTGWQGVGLAGDLLGNALISGYRALPHFAQDAVSNTAGFVGGLPSAGGGTIGEALPGEIASLSSQYEDFAEDNPRAAANIDALAGAASMFPPAKAASIVGKASKVVNAPITLQGTGLREAGALIKKIKPKAAPVTSKKIKEDSGRLYKLADRMGGKVKPGRLDGVIDDIAGEISNIGSTLPADARDAMRALSDPEHKIRQALEIVAPLKGESLDLKGFREIDQALGNVAYAASTPDDASRQLIMMQRKLRDAVETVTSSDIVGGENGFRAYSDGRDIWSKQARMSDLEGLTSRAFATEQPANALKRSLGRFLADEDNLRGFTKAEIDAITKASKTGMAGDILKLVGSRLGSNVAMGTGNLPLSAGLHAAGKGARTFSDDVMLRKMQNINELIATGAAPSPNTLGSVLGGGGSALEALGGGVEMLYAGPRGNLSLVGALQQKLKENEERKR